MSRDIFRIDWLPHRWLHKTSKLKPEIRGIYIQIINLIYCNEGPIDNDPKWISGVCNCSSRLVKSAILVLLNDGFIELSGEKLTQKRAEHVLNETRTRIEHSAKGGRTKAENERKIKQNKELISSDTPKPLSANNNNSTIPYNNKQSDYSEFYPDGKPTDIAYRGEVIKLNNQDYYRWWQSILPNITDEQFAELLQNRDKWLAKQSDLIQKKWFITTEKWLRSEARSMQ